MAYRRSSRRRSYSRSYSSRGRSAASRLGLNLSLPFLAGAAVGVSNLDNKIPKDVTLVAATAPIKGLGMVKGVAQGIILGNVVQHFTGFRTGATPGYSAAFSGF